MNRFLLCLLAAVFLVLSGPMDREANAYCTGIYDDGCGAIWYLCIGQGECYGPWPYSQALSIYWQYSYLVTGYYCSLDGTCGGTGCNAWCDPNEWYLYAFGTRYGPFDYNTALSLYYAYSQYITGWRDGCYYQCGGVGCYSQ